MTPYEVALSKHLLAHYQAQGLTMNQLIDMLDWRCDPKPSPYQVNAWLALCAMPAAEVVPALRAYRQAIVDARNGWFPHDYADRFPTNN